MTGSEHKELCAYLVRLTDVFSADFRKTNVVKFASRDKFGHNACALFEGNTMDDTCRLEQVKFLRPTKLGEDEIDFSFNCCFSVILGVDLQTRGGKWEGNAQISIRIERHAALHPDSKTGVRAKNQQCAP